ncbi:site-specific recombination directionality factor RDF [Mycobacterium phage Rey]|uniref:Lipoprotein n=1 Tax=Mycobacterium phage Rey TaxID=1034115 RepID=G1D5B0_9CAUD|nr:site-specific recombination directionality factor RDF [Mycobacterium phage Rey]AEK09960.1 hypothetical protein PBI_REY_48 [Mycobacterium phage Rey]
MSLKKIAAATLVAAAAITTLSACQDTDANLASQNLSQDADNFKIARRITFFNGITDKYLLTIEGRCSITPDTMSKKLDVTCKVGDGYKKHFLGLSDNVSYFVEQVDAANVSTDYYHVTFKPTTILPDIEIR